MIKMISIFYLALGEFCQPWQNSAQGGWEQFCRREAEFSTIPPRRGRIIFEGALVLPTRIQFFKSLAGDDGNQLCFLKSEEEVNCIAAAQNEGIVVVGFNWGIQVCRLLSGQASCRSISRILEHEISPQESSLGSTEKNFNLTFPVTRIAISANGRTIAVVTNNRNDLHVFRLSYNQEGAIEIEECFQETYNDDITEFGFSNEKLYVVQSKFVFIFNNEFNQTKVGHPGKILHIDWRLSDDDDSVFLTHSNCILRLWSGQENRIQLLASKSSPDMMFSFLNNSYYSHDETDYLVGISRGNFHLWSVSNLKKNNSIKSVVISTLRMIPNIYPNTSLSIKMHIQVRPYLARISELPLKRASSMFSLSPSITNSISMASVGASQKIFVDVVDSDGNLVTMTLSSSTNSFGDTTSIKSLCQASGHPADITTIDAHPGLPVIATGDEHGNVFIVKRLINKAHHKSVFKFDSEVVLKWIQSPEEMTSEILVALEQKTQELIIHSIIIDNGRMKRKQTWNLSVSNVKGVYRSNSKLIISYRDKNLLVDPIEETTKELEINSEIVGVAGQQQDFIVSKQRNSLSCYHVTDMKTPICPSLNFSDENILLAGPGLVFSWTNSGKKIECSLHSTTHTGFEMWELLDTLTIEKGPESFSENPRAFIFEHPNLTSTVFFILGRSILTVNILQQPPTYHVSVSPKGKIYLLSRFHTPGTLKKPTLIDRLDLKHFIAVCGKSLLLLQSEPSWSRPSYSPIALQKIINLGRVNMARGILTSFVEFFRSSVKSGNQREKMNAEIFTDSNLSEIRPNMPPLLTLLSQSFGSEASTHDSTRRRKSVMDPDTNDFERRLSEDLEKDLVLDFSSSESECSEEELDASEVTVSDILMRYRLAGITRSEQVTLEAIWECLNTVIPAGIDRAGTTFMLQWHHHRCMTKYLRSAPVKGDLPSSAIIWAFHSESQAEILSIIMESADFSWNLIKLTGVAFWCKSIASLRLLIEKLSRLIFQKEKDPMQVIVWYAILGKEKILGGLFKSVNNVKMAQFFGNDFTDTRWKQAALKNAFALLGKRRYLEAIGFFLIGGALKDALDVAQNRLHDNCLTLLIAKLRSGQDLYLDKLKELSKEDSFITSMFYWLEGNQIESVSIFLESEVCRKFDPAKTFNFYEFLSKHPLYTKALSIHGKNTSSTSQERVLCSRAVFEHLVSGCPLPAMLTLESLPKMSKELSRTEVSCDKPNQTLEKSSDMNWGEPEPVKEETLDLNWGEPEPVEEAGLDLEWSDDEKSDSENDSPTQNHDPNTADDLQVVSADGSDVLSDEISKSALTSFFLQEFSLTAAKEESSVDLESMIQNYVSFEADLRSIWPGYCPSLSTLLRKNRAVDSAKFQTSLKIHLESFQVCFPLLSFVRGAEKFYVSSDLQHIRHYFDKIVASISRYSKLPTVAEKITSRSALRQDYLQLKDLFDRLIPRSLSDDNTTDHHERSADESSAAAAFWPLNKGGFEATKLILEFTSITVLTLLVLALLDDSQSTELRIINRLFVSEFHSKRFLMKAFGKLSSSHEFSPPQEHDHLLNLLLQDIKDRHEFFENLFDEEYLDDDGFHECDSELNSRMAFFPRLSRAVALVIVQQRLAELNRMLESNMMKRIEDLIKKWSFDEFDVLSDVEIPLEAIPNFTPDMTVEQLNPFTSGSSPVARELSVQWTLLSKVHLLKPFFYQFVYDKIAVQNREDYEEVSQSQIDIQKNTKVSYTDPEVVYAVCSSSLLPKSTTLSMLYPLQEESDDMTLSLFYEPNSALKTESQQVAISTATEIIEFYPVIGNSKLEIRSRLPCKDIRRLVASPTDPMVYVAGSASGDVYFIQFAANSVTRILSAKESKSRIKCLTFCTSGSRLAVLAEDGSVRIWIVDQILFSQQLVPPVQRFNIGRDVLSICFLEGSSILISAGVHRNFSNSALCVWDLLTRQYLEPIYCLELREISESASAVTYSEKYQLICVGGKEGGLVFVDKDYLVVSSINFSGTVKCLNISGNGEILAVGSTDGSIRICSLAQQSLVSVLLLEHPRSSVFKNPTAGVMGLAFCGEHLLSCGADGKLKKRNSQALLDSSSAIPSQSESLSPLTGDEDCPKLTVQ